MLGPLLAVTDPEDAQGRCQRHRRHESSVTRDSAGAAPPAGRHSQSRSGQQLSCAEGSDSREVVIYVGGSLKTLRVSAGKATPQKTGRESREVPGTTEGLSGFTCPVGYVPEGTGAQDTQSPGAGGRWAGGRGFHLTARGGGQCKPGDQLCTCDQHL